MPRIVSPGATLTLVIVVLALAGEGASLAAAPRTGSTITGCYNATGTLRILTKPTLQRCKKGEKRITWSQKGPAGPPGPAGAQGSAGAKGDTGPSTGPAGGDLTGSYPNPSIATGKVGAAQLADGGVTGSKLAVPMSLSTGTGPNPFLSLTSTWQGDISPYTSGAVLSGTRTNTFGVGPAIYGTTDSIFGNVGTAGVFGEATGTGGYGVYALHSSSSGFGIALEAASNGAGNALQADANGTGAAAQFNGAVNVTGNLSVSGTISAGTKDFKIDDPLDPANKFLVHTSVESPQAENVYNGNLTTNAHGYATVSLPSYFDAENIQPRYQLTVIGSFARAVVWQEEHGNKFVVRTDQPRVKVSWQVTGIRNDPYAQSQRGPAEQSKSALDRGHFLYPQASGKPASLAIRTNAPRSR